MIIKGGNALYALALAFVHAICVFSYAEAEPSVQPARIPVANQKSSNRSGGTADHSKFDVLKKDFKSGPEVTEACLSCHTEAAAQIMDSIHWKWSFKHPQTGQLLGKRNVINSFCGNVASNEARCTSCHAGYGWDNMAAGPPKDQTRVDCLVCHDRSSTYSKLATKAGAPSIAPIPPKAKTVTGAPAVAVDLGKVAQSVGMPGRENCGQCHFYGGGGDNVKHGDLSSALYAASKETDVHMAKDGPNFACTNCHVTHEHKWSGSRYAVLARDETGTGKPGQRRDVATCESCHGITPHKTNSLKGIKLNDHTDRVACQTCHIPEFARGGVATKTKWDWSTAGKLKNGKPYAEENFVQSDGKHLHSYVSKKGDFEWGENVKPYYAWFDGQVRYTNGDTKIDPSHTVSVNTISGSPDDPKSRIWPFKRMKGRQAYDKKYRNLVHNQVFGPQSDTAFWTNFDWSKSIKAAMAYVGQPYSGEFDFVDTEMYWPITHMVAPKEDALACQECHAREGRLAQLPGLYLPGSKPWSLIDIIGAIMILGAAGGVLIHASIRTMTGRKGGQHD